MEAERFLATLIDDVLDPHEFSDASGVSKRLSDLDGAIRWLDRIKDDSEYGEFLHSREGLPLGSLLLGIPEGSLKTQVDSSTLRQFAAWRMWLHDARLRDVIVGLLIAEAQESRTQRRRKKFAEIVRHNLETATRLKGDDLVLRTGMRVRAARLTRIFDYVIYYREQPAVAVVDVFQTSAGGRQQVNFLDLPHMQTALAQEGVVLLAICDGPGFKSMAPYVRRIAPRLEHFTNLEHMDGEVMLAIEQAIDLHSGRPIAESQDLEDILTRITTLALRSGRTVTGKLLGVSAEDADAFLLRYQAANPDYVLVHQGHGEITTEAAEEISLSQAVFEKLAFGRPVDATTMVQSLADRLGCPVHSYESNNRYALFGIETSERQIRLPNPLPLFVAGRYGQGNRACLTIVEV